MRDEGRRPHLPATRRGRRLLVLVAAFVLAAAGASVPALVSHADDAQAQAVGHKSPFDCGMTFNANNWIGDPPHNPANSIDWQNHGPDDPINGKTVRATAAGTAHFHNEGSTSYGRWVEVTHSDGTATRYAHLATQVQDPGTSMSVDQGTVIGTVGSTGGSSAPHLHYEQRNASGSTVSPTVEGTDVPQGTKTPITSTNGCGDSGNPYTPGEVCGSGFSQINSHELGDAGVIVLMYNSADSSNCVVTLKHDDVGTASAVSATLEVQDGASSSDSGDFEYYAGPVTESAASTCVKWGGSVGSESWTSDWSHCG